MVRITQMTDAEAISKKLNVSEAVKRRNPEIYGQPVAGLGSAEPQHREVQTLASGPPEQKSRAESVSNCRVLIVRYGRRRLDDDNLVASYKALRDTIATEHLGVDDADPRITWHYDQVISKTTGTHILLTQANTMK